MKSILKISQLCKVYESGFEALKKIDLDIYQGEIFALLGPNGAGKTTLISAICGIVSPSSGSVTVDGHDIITGYRETRRLIGLVPQELTLGAFDTVWNTVNFSRGLFGKKPNPAYIEQLLKDLSLFDKKDTELRALSGGMKRRVLIAKALSHEPRVLFLDEPTAGVDVELRKDMWALVRGLNKSGVTIILTTHYIEEAEEIADRVGIISGGELIMVEDKQTLMQKLGRKQLVLDLKQTITSIPQSLENYQLELSSDGSQLTYTYDSASSRTDITALLQSLSDQGISMRDLKTSQSSLEDIFVSMVRKDA
ncbi:MAG: ABC-2 type transport system ATP-binding protein [Candidatus Azotimanducaceae bacterium]|jgi:ABC-2 type transport system ATP-binding protein